MGASKGNYLAMLLVVFVLYLSLIYLIFRQSGAFFKIELVIWLILGLLAIIFLSALSSKSRWAWSGLFILFVLHFINIFAIYSRTLQLKELAIPIIVSIIGLYLSAIKIEHDEEDFSCEAPEAEPTEEVLTNVPEEEENSKKKKARKKK